MDRSFFHFVTSHAFDRQPDGQTEFSMQGGEKKLFYLVNC